MTPSGDTYIHGHSDSVLRSHRWRTAANSAAYLLPHLGDGQRLLDVGCGPGTLTVDLARHVGPTGLVVGVDVSESVVGEAAAHAATDVTYTTSTWTFATPANRAWWGELWAERTVSSSLGEQAVDYGVATRTELEAVAAAFRDWARRPDSTFVLVHGELIARPPSSARSSDQ